MRRRGLLTLSSPELMKVGASLRNIDLLEQWGNYGVLIPSRLYGQVSHSNKLYLLHIKIIPPMFRQHPCKHFWYEFISTLHDLYEIKNDGNKVICRDILDSNGKFKTIFNDRNG